MTVSTATPLQPKTNAPATEEMGEVSATVQPSVDDAADNSRKVLVYLQKGEALGDSVVHVPTYRAARLAFPRHHIVSLCSHPSVYATKSFSPMAGQFLDRVLTMQPINRGPVSLARVLSGLGPIDVVIEFRSSLNALWSYLATTRARCYVANVAGYLLRRGVRQQAILRPATNAARFHRLIEVAAGRPLPFDCRLPARPDALMRATKLLPAGPRYIGLIPGPSASIKSWPLEKFVELARKLSASGLQPVMLLGLGETAEEARLTQLLPGTILIGPSSVEKPSEDLAWLIHAVAARLTACVAVEGGLGHLVATQEVPLVTLEGPTNAQRWRPLTPHWWLLRSRDFGSHSTSAIPVHAVLNVLEEMSRWSAVTNHGRSERPPG